MRRIYLLRRAGPAALAALWLACASCGEKRSGQDEKVRTLGSIEVTARLAAIPEGAIFKRELYNYAAVLEYEVIAVHRGQVEGTTIHVGHYNPFEPRAEAADEWVPEVGGDLAAFKAGQAHRMALEPSLEERYMGGVVDKYFGTWSGPIYWAVWTNLVE